MVAAALGLPAEAVPGWTAEPEPPRGSFAAWLRAELGARGWTPAELARRTGAHPTGVYGWLAGRQDPSRDSRALIARALGVPVSALPPVPGRRRGGR